MSFQRSICQPSSRHVGSEIMELMPVLSVFSRHLSSRRKLHMCAAAALIEPPWLKTRIVASSSCFAMIFPSELCDAIHVLSVGFAAG